MDVGRGSTESWIGSEFSALELQLSPSTGLPTGLRSGSTASGISIAAGASLMSGGVEKRGPLGGLAYEGAVEHRDIRATGPVRARLERDARVYTVPVELGGWVGSASYTFRADAPSLTWTWSWRATEEAADMRAFLVSLRLHLDASRSWVVNAPGNRLRRDLPLKDMPSSTPVAGIGGLAGSAGLVALTDEESASTLVVWARSKDEFPAPPEGGRAESVLSVEDHGVQLVHSTGLAAASTAETDLHQDGIALDLLGGDFGAVIGSVPRWFADLGITTPVDSPEWTRGATIYEAQIGTSIFAGGSWTYSPYPEVSDLYADLPRVAAMGFDTIQIMPRQPFPSYNVVDFDDVDLSYGDETQLRQVVQWCHEHGIKVIVDVLLHGVIDRESITEAADAVRSGPWAHLVGADAAEVDGLKLDDEQQRELSWSRHVIDFEESWREGSAQRHPLCVEHPEWFCTDSSGRVIGIYTKAFDMSNPQWQEYFSDAMTALVERLDIDGFRFDAPTYNAFPNWGPRTRTRASLQTLGCVSLFTHLRERLHALDPELMLYTEPNGALLRQSMDLNYNYDEKWLPSSLFHPDDPRHVGGIRSGREFARWLSDRDRTLPSGAVTAHHIDSHDTFWWPLPGSKWRREQFGMDAARALMCAFALSGGPYMMFVGGEAGMEEMVARVNRLRSERRELSRGRHTFGEVECSSDAIFSVTHEDGELCSVVLVNMSSREVRADIRLAQPGGRLVDLLDVDGQPFELGASPAVVFGPYQARLLVAAGT